MVDYELISETLDSLDAIQESAYDAEIAVTEAFIDLFDKAVTMMEYYDNIDEFSQTTVFQEMTYFQEEDAPADTNTNTPPPSQQRKKKDFKTWVLNFFKAAKACITAHSRKIRQHQAREVVQEIQQVPDEIFEQVAEEVKVKKANDDKKNEKLEASKLKKDLQSKFALRLTDDNNVMFVPKVDIDKIGNITEKIADCIKYLDYGTGEQSEMMDRKFAEYYRSNLEPLLKDIVNKPVEKYATDDNQIKIKEVEFTEYQRKSDEYMKQLTKLDRVLNQKIGMIQTELNTLEQYKGDDVVKKVSEEYKNKQEIAKMLSNIIKNLTKLTDGVSKDILKFSDSINRLMQMCIDVGYTPKKGLKGLMLRARVNKRANKQFKRDMKYANKDRKYADSPLGEYKPIRYNNFYESEESRKRREQSQQSTS